jgi:hypothetical protein
MGTALANEASLEASIDARPPLRRNVIAVSQVIFTSVARPSLESGSSCDSREDFQMLL